MRDFYECHEFKIWVGLWLARNLAGSVFDWHALVGQGYRWALGFFLGVLCYSRCVWCLFLAFVCGGYWVLRPGFRVVGRVGSSGQGPLAGSG